LFCLVLRLVLAKIAMETRTRTINPLKKEGKKTLKEDIDLSLMKSSIKVKLLCRLPPAR
jgi:hypothetical protein